ncbi:btb poz domain-containing protein 9 [Lasius niger]|uniref:Probable small nuclear ribonucleoprotein E n=1 Tax=Lasius niger TaxID=67767 RepID=A0A0J7L8P5_LASNI|nr:btb poz domain-containing protein 9 [Lasius niger]
MSYKGPQKVQKVMVQPINLIFRYLQNRSRVQVWLFENVNLRIEGHIVGFDEYMNLVLDDAEEYHQKTKNRKQLGRIMLKGDNITLIQNTNPGGKTACSSFIEKCFAFIGENAVDTVKTTAFCNLPKDALVKLISSDYLGLEEEDVWRAVLNWAKYQAGVTQPTQHWTEEERIRVCQHLSGVINHVRLLLIDSQVFAEEVEPTGAVPIEMSLDRYDFFSPDRSSGSKFLRYRYAALPNKYAEICADKRLHPRVSPFLFPSSQILSRDKGMRGEICGGFSDVAWGKTNSKAQYIASEKSFLFTLTNNQDIPPTKFEIVKKSFAICYHPDIGPIFGAGADLLISSNCNVNKESYSNLPHSYEGDHASNQLLMGDYHFSVVDYEVFTPSHPVPKSNH